MDYAVIPWHIAKTLDLEFVEVFAGVLSHDIATDRKMCTSSVKRTVACHKCIRSSHLSTAPMTAPSAYRPRSLVPL